METNDLTVVIVTFKSEEVIFSCLDSIPDKIKVIVVENSNNKKFKEIIDKARPNHLWKISNGKWQLKHPIWKENVKK